jgi:hypothetical protein
MCNPQATSPFIDPVTKKKIAFVDKGPREALEMSERFELHTLDTHLGGSLKSNLFDLEQYAQRMKVRGPDMQHYYPCAL